MTASNKFQVGDKVQYNGTFLRSAMNRMSLASLRGTIESFDKLPAITYATVVWTSLSPLPTDQAITKTWVNVAKLKKVK